MQKLFRFTMNKKITFLIGMIVGTIVFLCIYGSHVLDFTNVNWLLDSSKTEGLWDLTQHYLGWVYYRNSSWHFPFGLTDGLFSDSISIFYSDSIPLFAVIFKILSPILPSTFQYLGLFGLICYAFMGGFGSLITYKFCHNSYLNMVSALLFSTAPVLLKRMFYHTALSAHFLILASFCLWIYRNEIKNRAHYIILWTLLCVSATLINPYFTPMILGVFLCSLFQEFICGYSLRKIAIEVIVPLIITFLCCFLMGMFYGNVPASAGGLDILSFNLLQLFNPANMLLEIVHREYFWTIQNYSLFLPTLSVLTPWQEEGFSYLGLGLILLFLCTICLAFVKLRNIIVRKQLSKDKISYFISIFTGFFVFTFLAIGPTATLGTRTLYHITYSDTLYKILSIFRSTGRLIWPVYYGIITLCLICLAKSLSEKSVKFYLALTIIAIIQLVDLYPAFKYKHQAYTQTFIAPESSLTSSAWDTLGKDCSKIMFYTPTLKGIACDPMTSCTFAEYGLKYNLSLNITYLSRDITSIADDRIKEHFKLRKKGERFPDTIYIFFDISEIPPAEESGLNYYEIDDYIVGTDLNLDDCDDVKIYHQ